MMMRKEVEQHSNKFPALCTASKHVGHIWGGRKRREGGTGNLKKKENIIREMGTGFENYYKFSLSIIVTKPYRNQRGY